jgi:hypothetical protein
MFRYILSLILLLSIFTPAYADTLIQRYKHSEVYQTAQGAKKIVIGGDISNAYPFDTDGDMRPQSYNWTEAREIAPNVYRLADGEFGYTVYKNTGEIRVHPIRKRWDIYWSVSPLNPTPLNYRQVNEKLLELYVDTAHVRYSFFIGDTGFKVNNRLKPSYSGGDQWAYTYNVALVGMTREGRTLLHDGVAVGNLPNPFMVDAEGTTLPVVETLNAGQLTLTATGINSLVLPVDIDPTLGPVDPSADTRIVSAAPTTNYANSNLGLNAWNINMTRTLFRFDLSSIPAGSTVSSTDIQITVYSNNLSASREGKFHPITSTWLEAQATWNNRQSGTPWSSAGADFNAGVVDTVTVVNSNIVQNYTIDNTIQDCIDNGRDDFIFKFTDETDGSNRNALFRESEYETPADRPKLTVVYIEPVTQICPWRLDQKPPVWCY